MYISGNFSAPTKATSGRPAYSPALYQIQSAIAKLLVSFRCPVKIRKGQAGETAWCYGCPGPKRRDLIVAYRQVQEVARRPHDHFGLHAVCITILVGLHDSIQ